MQVPGYGSVAELTRGASLSSRQGGLLARLAMVRKGTRRTSVARGSIRLARELWRGWIRLFESQTISVCGLAFLASLGIPGTIPSQTILPEVPRARFKTVGSVSAQGERITFELGTHQVSAETWCLGSGCITRAAIGSSTLVVATNIEAETERYWLRGSSPIAYYPETGGGLQTANLHGVGVPQGASRRRFVHGGHLLGDYSRAETPDGATVHESLLEVEDVRPPIQSLATATVRDGRVVEYTLHLGSEAEGWTPRFSWRGEGNAPGVPELPARIVSITYTTPEDSTEVRENTIFDLRVTEAERLGPGIDYDAKVEELTRDLEPVQPGISPDRFRRLARTHPAFDRASQSNSPRAEEGWLAQNRAFGGFAGGLGGLALLAAWFTFRSARRSGGKEPPRRRSP